MKFLLSALVVFVLFSCTSAQNNSTTTISAIEYFKKLSTTKNKQILDVRTPGEFNSEHLANAVNIDYQSSTFETELEKLDKSKPVFLYCLSGGRSGEALNIMARKGFKEVYNLQGGIMAWKAQNYPLNNSNPAAQSWKGMTKEEFTKIINDKTPVLVDFNAVWCGPCKQLKPILNELQAEYPSKLKVVFLDVDVNKSLADDMKIRQIPFMTYYVNGKVKMNIEGLTDKANLIKALGLK